MAEEGHERLETSSFVVVLGAPEDDSRLGRIRDLRINVVPRAVGHPVPLGPGLR